MPSIRETLEEIPGLLREIEAETEKGDLDNEFLVALNNFIAVYYLDLVAHASCVSQIEKQKSTVDPNPFLQQYEKLATTPAMLDEKIRLDNIKGLFFLWAVFEQFVFRNTGGTSKKAGDFQVAHRRLMESKGVKRKRVKEIEAVTMGIRRTRNSLHSGGTYENEAKKSYELLGDEYELVPGEQVNPLRLLTVIRFFLSHYRELDSVPDGF